MTVEEMKIVWGGQVHPQTTFGFQLPQDTCCVLEMPDPLTHRAIKQFYDNLKFVRGLIGRGVIDRAEIDEDNKRVLLHSVNHEQPIAVTFYTKTVTARDFAKRFDENISLQVFKDFFWGATTLVPSLKTTAPVKPKVTTVTTVKIPEIKEVPLGQTSIFDFLD